jgi:imidazoleglycerol-phosphate dehydratase
MARRARAVRETKETRIEVAVDLDGTGAYAVETPIGFLTHMVEQIARHSLVDLEVRATGDVVIDGHHTTEDLALTLGKAVADALGDKVGIRRYGSATLPMDEACVTCAIDLSGRPFYVGKLDLAKAKVGEFDSELTDVFFEGFARGAQCNVHVYKLAGDNLHHSIEIAFKAFARALREAASIDARAAAILPSTKGTLGG